MIRDTYGAGHIAELVGVNRSTAKKWIARGLLPSERTRGGAGRRGLVTHAALLRWLLENLLFLAARNVGWTAPVISFGVGFGLRRSLAGAFPARHYESAGAFIKDYVHHSFCPALAVLDDHAHAGALVEFGLILQGHCPWARLIILTRSNEMKSNNSALVVHKPVDDRSVLEVVTAYRLRYEKDWTDPRTLNARSWGLPQTEAWLRFYAHTRP